MATNRRGTGKKVFIVGLDGATLDLLGPWVEHGELPWLRKMLDRGAVGGLQSTVPPVTPVAWLSLMTGKGPGRHGVFDLLRPVSADYMEITAAYGHHCQEPTLWDILSDRGRKVGLINVPMTYPPKKVNGFMISGIPAPANKDNYCYPPSLIPELQAMGWDLTRDASAMADSYEDNLGYLAELVETRTQAAMHLMNQYEWDVFMVHFLETDQVQHIYWRFMEDDATPPPGPAQYGTAILDLFKRIEGSLRRMTECLDEDTIVMLVSDHGMGPTRYHVNLNNWLLGEGLMVWKRNWAVRLKRALYSVGMNPTALYNLLARRLVRRTLLGRARTDLAHVPTQDPAAASRRRRGLAALLRDWLCLSMKDIDWSRTLAYSSGTTQAGLIYLNVKGRDPQGIVEFGPQYEELRTLVCRRIVDFIDPDRGERLFARAFRREELYSGAHVPEAPDIVVLCTKGEYNIPLTRLFLSRKVAEPICDATASHRMNGLIAMIGPDVVRHDCAIAGAQITDVAPTILYLLGEEIPSDMDGKVLRGCLTESFVASNPEKHVAPRALPAEPGDEEAALLTPEDLESLRRTLEGLGYL
jgi:predicted AlkP superfamily phosphohydrolase/phosphomutase